MRTATSYHPRGKGPVPKGKRQFVVDIKYDAGRLRKRGIIKAAPVQSLIEEGLEHKV